MNNGGGESDLFTRLSLKDMLSQRLKRDNYNLF